MASAHWMKADIYKSALINTFIIHMLADKLPKKIYQELNQAGSGEPSDEEEWEWGINYDNKCCWIIHIC